MNRSSAEILVPLPFPLISSHFAGLALAGAPLDTELQGPQWPIGSWQLVELPAYRVRARGAVAQGPSVSKGAVRPEHVLRFTKGEIEGGMDGRGLGAGTFWIP